jgi:SOS regulatory protein LexA
MDYKQQVRKFYSANRHMPSYSEMMSLFGFKSKNSVFKLVNKWLESGFVKKDDHGRLLPAHIYGDLKTLGYVEAGFPSPAEEELADTITFDEYLVGNREATYILRVRGESMKDAGIMEGDMVVVERGITPKDMDIVIAEVDGEWTIKYFRKKGNTIFLEPANDDFKPIYPKEELKVSAVVRAVVRKY